MVISKEMSITHTEFFRTLSRTYGAKRYQRDGTSVRFEDGSRSVTITLAPETTRRMGAMALPATRVDLRFQGYDETEMHTFIDEFDLHFRRGGG